MSDTLSAILSAGAGPLAMFIDFDGTLVDIAPTPDAVVVPPDLVPRLQSLNARLDGALALVSGRMLADIDRHLPGHSFAASGSHGIERRHRGQVLPTDPALVSGASRLAERLHASLGTEDGILIEPKTTGVAVHFRAAPQKEDLVRGAFGAVLAGLDQFHTVEGKKVIEARPRSADKGSAVRALMGLEPFAGRTPVFVGDDVTDEDGFAAVQDLGGFGIKIGQGETRARFRLPDIETLYRYFDALIAASSERPAGPDTLQEGMVK